MGGIREQGYTTFNSSDYKSRGTAAKITCLDLNAD